MTAISDEGFDLEHPDPQHEMPGESTDDPADFGPGDGIQEDLGEVPTELPDPEGE